MLENVCENVSHRILVEGETGSGKSTLLDKLTYDWATRKEDITNLLQFDLIFLIKVSQLSTSSLSEYCVEHFYKDTDSAILFFSNCVENNNVLFLIDGLDELGNSSNQDLEDLFNGHIYPSCSFVVTSRQGIDFTGHVGNSYTIRGLDNESITTFLKRYKTIMYLDYSLECFPNHPFRPLLKVPMFLWFYVLLYKELVDTNDLTNRTELYTKVVNALKRRAKLPGKTLCYLTEEAYNCLCKGNLRFSLSDQEEHQMKSFKTLGFLDVKNSDIVFTHKQIMEYLAAEYVCNNNTKANIIDLIAEVEEYRNKARPKTSLFLQFIFGHLSEPSKINEVFQKYVPPFSDNSLYGLECVAECGFFAELNEYWHTYIPNKVTLDMSQYTLFSQKGLHEMITSCQEYQLECLICVCNNTDIRDVLILSKLFCKAKNNTLKMTGECNMSELLEPHQHDTG